MTSLPGRDGSKSETCRASPWPRPVVYRPRPEESMAAGEVYGEVEVRAALAARTG